MLMNILQEESEEDHRCGWILKKKVKLFVIKSVLQES
jgi:hypothetical protein